MGLLTDLGVAALIDEACGPRPSGLALSPGTYLALTVLTRVVDPCSKRGFADWWRTTAADRFTKIATSTLDHRRFWDALHAVPLDGLAQIETKLALGVCARYGLDTSSVALDMTNFATIIETPATARRRSRSGAKRSRNEPTCAWSDWGWSSPATAASRCCPTPTPATNPTSPSSPA